MHKYDPGTYSITLFTKAGRPRRKQWLKANFLSSQFFVRAWARRTGGTGVITKCLYNSALVPPTMSSKGNRYA